MHPEFHPRLRHLAVTFTYTEAREVGLSDRLLYELRDEGSLRMVGRGLFRKENRKPARDPHLLEIALRARTPTLCLGSALAMHGLADEMPAVVHIALPRDAHRPTLLDPVVWHSFDRATFELGRERLHLEDDVYIGVFSAPRSIVDTIRQSRRGDEDRAAEAIRRWLSLPGSSAKELLELAKSFPGAEKKVRQVLVEHL